MTAYAESTAEEVASDTQDAGPRQRVAAAGREDKVHSDPASHDVTAANEEAEQVRLQQQDDELRRARDVHPGRTPAPPSSAGDNWCWDSIRYSHWYQTFGRYFLYAVYASLTIGTLFVLFYPINQPEPEESTVAWMRKTVQAKLRMAYPDECRDLLDDFSNAFADFMACITRHSRPPRICTKCRDSRWAIERAYENLQRGSGTATASCHYEIFGQTELDLISFNYRFYHRMMDLHACDLCMAKVSFGAYDVFETVVEYIDSHEAFRACMIANSGKKLPPSSSESLDSGSDDEPADPDLPAACSVCRDMAVRQGTLLQKVAGRPMFPLSEQATCMDVVDVANETHRLWHCSGCPLPRQLRPRMPSLYMCIYVAGVLGNFALLFYILLRCKCCDPYHQRHVQYESEESETETETDTEDEDGDEVDAGRDQREHLVSTRRRLT